MLPIPSRGGGSAPSGGGLPIPARGQGELDATAEKAESKTGVRAAEAPAEAEKPVEEKPRPAGLLPIAHRGGDPPGKGLLPIAHRGGDPSGLLPIAHRGDSSQGLLPIAHRGADGAETNPPAKGLLPIAHRGDDAPAPKPAARGMGLPIAHRGENAPAPTPAATGMGLPIAHRGEDAPKPKPALGLPIANREKEATASSGIPIPSRTAVHFSERVGVDGVSVEVAEDVKPVWSRRGSTSSNQEKVVRPRQLMDGYIVGEMLGEGAFSIVYACTTKGNWGDYAVKMVDKVESPMEAIKQEVALLESLKHPNIVKFIEVFFEKCFVCIVLERFRGGDLFNGMTMHWDDPDKGRIPGHKVIHVKRQIFDAVRFLHHESVVHRDVKGDNYLLDRLDLIDPDCHVTLTDFGTACRIGNKDRLREHVGTRTYWSPEFFRKDYGKKVDDWAVGIVVCGLLTGAFPFNSDGAVMDPDRPAKIAGHLPKECLDMVSKLLLKDEAQRITASQAAEHPWMMLEHTEDGEELIEPCSPSRTHVPTKSHAATRETGPDGGIRERRMELFERLEDEAARRSTMLGRRLSTSGKLEKLVQPRFLMPSKRTGKQVGYEWWSIEDAASILGQEVGADADDHQVPLKRGDRVRVMKASRCHGKTAVVIQPYWHGLVKVNMDEEDEKGMTKSFKQYELELIDEPLDEEPLFQEGDRVRITKQSRLQGKTAIVTDPSSSGLVKVRVEEDDERGNVKCYKPYELVIVPPEEQSVDESRGVNDLGTANVNVQVIGKMLEDHGIDTSVFGKGQAKSLRQFALEVQRGTSQLMLDATRHRTLVRVVNIVLLRICFFWGSDVRCLVEICEESPAGWRRDMPRLIGTKKEPFENTKKAAQRIAQVYLPDGKVNFNFEGTEKYEETEISPSYPGVRTVYRKEIVEGWVTTSKPDVLRRIGFESDAKWKMEDTRGLIKTFHWMTAEACEEMGVHTHPPDEHEESCCLVKAPAVGMSEEKLRTDLKNNGIDIKKFNSGAGANTLADLAEESRRGECSFVMEPDGRVLRMVEVVLLKLTKTDPDNPGKKMILIQADEAPMDNPEDVKVLNRLPGHKMQPTENEFLIAQSMITNKLQIEPNCVSLNPDTVDMFEQAKLSNSYPGLLTYYRKRVISGEVIMPKVSEFDDATPASPGSPETLRTLSP